jgi:CubicO group peptidase (beta-lactamase class C family)
MITADPEKVGLSSSRLKRISQLTHSYVDSGRLAGTITMVARRGEVVHFEAYGKLSLESGEPMVEDAIFRIFSMTKPITSVAIMMLYEQGYLELVTPLSKFIPAFKNVQVFESGTVDDYKTVKPEREITILDLLKHTAGLSYGFFGVGVVDEIYKANDIGPLKLDYTLEEFVNKIASMPLVFSPGNKWNYSLATDVLGRVIEVISGMPLDLFLKKNIFDPLGMVDTDFYVTPDKLDRLTDLYAHRSAVPADVAAKFPNEHLFPYDDHKDGSWSNPVKHFQGGGGLVSTARDYYRFVSMLMNKGRFDSGNLLSPKSIELMTMNHLPEDLYNFSAKRIGGMTAAGNGFGLGFSIILDPARVGVIGTPGEYHWSGSAHTSFFVDPKEELFGMILTQAFPPGAYPINREFRAAVLQSIIE